MFTGGSGAGSIRRSSGGPGCTRASSSLWAPATSAPVRMMPWVYAGIILTVGASNLGSRSRVCRFGTLILLLATLVFGVDLAREFARLPKDAAGKLAGSMWVDKDPVIRDMIIEQ